MMMKAELKTVDLEEEKEKKRKEKLEKIEAAAAERLKKQKQKRILVTNDRLLDDKVIHKSGIVTLFFKKCLFCISFKW